MQRIIAVLSMAGMLLFMGCHNSKHLEQENKKEEEAVMKRVMVTPLAGQWYHDSERALRDEIHERIRGIVTTRKKNICAAVVPHAGYRYSGRVAAGVYLRILPAEYDRIVIMGPSHYVNMPNEISVPDATHYATPLGELRADTAFIHKLRRLSFVKHHPAAHTREHSDQIQLPLIQHCLSTNIPIVCMVCGQFNARRLVEAASALREVMDDKTLFIASSDFTHYGASYGYVPFEDNVFENLKTLDMGVFELFANRDLAGFMRYLEETGATVCGRDPLAFLIAMMPENAKVERTAYTTSGQMTSNTTASVSYIGALVSGKWSSSPGLQQADGRQLDVESKLSQSDGTQLLSWARQVLTRSFALSREQAARSLLENTPDKLKLIRGGFVTLRKQGRLRGCIGEILPRRELWQVVRDQALNAAFSDSRFMPLVAEELGDISIEISVLTPPVPVASWQEIKVGKHGIILQKGGDSSVFLPQVAVEQGWGIEETLNNLALKAGLSASAWREGTDFLVFEAQVFAEQE